jgi:hypothetical protein
VFDQLSLGVVVPRGVLLDKDYDLTAVTFREIKRQEIAGAAVDRLFNRVRQALTELIG